MVWIQEGALGVTVNGGDSHAWNELQSFVRNLKTVCPGLEITDWDSGDDISDAFFGSYVNLYQYGPYPTK